MGAVSDKAKENQKRYKLEFAKNEYKRVPLDMKKADYEKLVQAASASEESVNGYIKNAINQRMERDGFSAEEKDEETSPKSLKSADESDKI